MGRDKNKEYDYEESLVGAHLLPLIPYAHHPKDDEEVDEWV